MGGTSNGGLNDGVTYKGFVEWSVFDANGNLKQYNNSHNALNTDQGLSDTVNRLIGGVTTEIDLIVGSTEGTGADSFARIFLAEVARSAGGDAQVYESTDQVENVGSDTADDTVGSNPAQGVVTASTGANGSGTVVLTFEAEATETITELALVTTASRTAATDGAIADTAILAVQDVDITLADEDTLAITWTVTATGS